MSANLDATRAYFAAIDSDRAPDTRALFAPEFEFVTPFGVITDLDEHTGFSAGFYAAFPGMTHDNRRAYEIGDDVVILEGQWTGTHTGPMTMPDGNVLPATGATVTFPYAVVIEFEAGLVRKVRAYFDNVAFLTQLGLMPAAV